jgi:hypothetical protein
MSQGPNPLEGDGLAEALPDQTQCASTTLGAKLGTSGCEASPDLYG